MNPDAFYARLSTGLIFVASSLMISGCVTGQINGEKAPAAAAAAAQAVKDIRVIILTTKGEIHGTLYASRVPMTAANFVNLAQRKFYDGIVFHRVIPDFMAQVGDPLSKNPRMEGRWGTGGPGYRFNDEIDPALKHDRPGIFSMANSGRNTNGSQIFITHVPTPHLDGKHAVFGGVTKGQDVVNAIKKGDKIVQIRILDDTTALLESQAANIAKWNEVLGK